MDYSTKEGQRQLERLRQDVEVLLGQRGAENRPLSALRRGELLPLASRTLLSAQVATAPTMAQHNALQSDVKMIFDALALISNRLGNAPLPGI